MKPRLLIFGVAGLVLLGVGSWALAERPWEEPTPEPVPPLPGPTLAAATAEAASPADQASRLPAGLTPHGTPQTNPYWPYPPPEPSKRTPIRSTRSFHHAPAAEAEAVETLLELCRMIRSARTTREELIAYLGRVTWSTSHREDWSGTLLPRSEVFRSADLQWGRDPDDTGADGSFLYLDLELSDAALLSLRTMRAHFGTPKESRAVHPTLFSSLLFEKPEQPAGDYLCMVGAEVNWDGEDPDDILDNPKPWRVFNYKRHTTRRGRHEKEVWMASIDLSRSAR